MTQFKKTVFGVCRTVPVAESALTALETAGFKADEVSILTEKGTGIDSKAEKTVTHSAEGAVIGAGTGAVVGGALGWLAGLGLMLIPGVGPFLAIGPAMGLLAGATMGGAAGSLAGALLGLGVPESEAKKYEGHLKKGGILLGAHCMTIEKAEQAAQIMRNVGAEDIATVNEVSAVAPTA